MWALSAQADNFLMHEMPIGNKKQDAPMTYARPLAILCFFLGLCAYSGNVFAQSTQADLRQKLPAMEEKYNYCESNKHNFGSSRSSNVSLADRQKVTDCRRFCIQGNSLSEYLEPGKSASAYTLETTERVLNACNEAYLASKEVLEPILGARPASVSDKYGLTNQRFKSEIDREHENCVAFRTPSGEQSGCDCTAEKVIQQINETGSYTRIHRAFQGGEQACWPAVRGNNRAPTGRR